MGSWQEYRVSRIPGLFFLSLLTPPRYSKIANSQTAQTHRLDFTPMNDFISHVLDAIDRDGAEIAAVFPGLAGLTVVYKFAERLANDVVRFYLFFRSLPY